MSADSREFADASVPVYAFDASAGSKQRAASELLERLRGSGTGCVSVQVLQEFFVTVTRKVTRPLPIDDAAERVRELAAWRIFSPTADDILGAIAVQQQAGISFWDAMVVRAAAEMECDVLWTEDLTDGQTLRGVVIRSPFTGSR
jgi:predicted nucleic acid-binding protein